MASTKMVGASHTIRVKTLYRHALKNLQNWTVWRELFIEKGFELRAQFDAQKKLTDPKMIEKVVSEAEAKLQELRHPDPYTRARRDRHPAPPKNTPPPALLSLFCLLLEVLEEAPF